MAAITGTIEEETKKTVFIAATPNVEQDDLSLAKILLFSSVENETDPRAGIETSFSKTFNSEKAFLYNSGRAALYALLKAMGVGEGDEVITQAYTCLAVPTGIMWAGATPRYADIDPLSLNLTATSIKAVLSKKTRAMLVQHTFGKSAAIDAIKEMIDSENEQRPEGKRIFLIEDCAHSLGGEYKNKPLGSWGDGAFFSFGQDKVISCTRGGLALSSHEDITRKLSQHYETIPEARRSEARRAVLHPLLWDFIRKTYYVPGGSFTIGRGAILVFRFLGLLKSQADPRNLDLTNPNCTKLSEHQAFMLEQQMKKLDRFIVHRKEIAAIYNKHLPEKNRVDGENHTFLRFPLQVENPHELEAHLKKHRIIPGNWYSSPIHPKGADLKRFQYEKGSCPNAERTASISINIPTSINITKEDAHRIGKLCAEKLA